MATTTQRLTNSIIQNMKHGDVVLDTVVQGLRVRKRHPIKAAVFEFRRQKNGVRHFASVGRWGEITIEEARDEVRDLIRGIRHGETPTERRAKARLTMISVRELCERYLDEYGSTHLKARTVETYRSNYRNVIFPSIGSKIVETLNDTQVRRMHFIAYGRTPAQANHAVCALSGAFNWAISIGLLPRDFTNPCVGVRRPLQPPRKRILTPEETKRLAASLKNAEEWADPAGLIAILLQIVTGARIGEILNLKWEFIRYDLGCILLPRDVSGTKNQDKEIIITPVAKYLLQRVPEIAGSAYVFPSPADISKPRARVKRLWERVRKDAGIPDVRTHDLRRSYISAIAANGDGLFAAQQLVGHKSVRTTEAYAWMFRNDRAATAARISNSISRDYGLSIDEDDRSTEAGSPNLGARDGE